MKDRYEFVSTKESDPIRNQLASVFEKVKVILAKAKEKPIILSWTFVGSANRNGESYITRIINGNKGFDIDVNFNIEKPAIDDKWTTAGARYLKTQVREALKKALAGTLYSDPEDKTSVLKIKVKDTKDSRIIHSCDIAIFSLFNDPEGNQQRKFIRFDGNGKYVWAYHGKGSKLIDKKLSELHKKFDDKGVPFHNGLKINDVLKEEYLKLINIDQ
jgi:hypothetical protein